VAALAEIFTVQGIVDAKVTWRHRGSGGQAFVRRPRAVQTSGWMSSRRLSPASSGRGPSLAILDARYERGARRQA